MPVVVTILEYVVGLAAVVFTLSIPLAWSPVGRALAEAIRARGGSREVTALEARVQALEGEIHQLREALVLGDARRRTPPAVEQGSESAARPQLEGER